MKTMLALILLLCFSWVLEIPLGVQVVRVFWNYDLGGSLASTVAGAGSALLSVLHSSPAFRYHRYWTSAGVTDSFVRFYLFFHGLWAFLSLLWPAYERWKLGVRGPSQREVEQFTAVLTALTRRSYDVARPGRWVVADGPGLGMRQIGYVLVIDRSLLYQRSFLPLLAHELGYVNSADRLARRLFAMLPDRRTFLFVLLGLPVGCASLLLFPLWMWYWRHRVFAADAYAVHVLGQGHALIQALNDLYLPLDHVTRFGRWLQPVPYIESRIARIQRVMPTLGGMLHVV